jgi:hypothetical protein
MLSCHRGHDFQTPVRALVLSSSPIRHGFPVSFRITQMDQSDRSTVLLSDVLFGQDSLGVDIGFLSLSTLERVSDSGLNLLFTIPR